MVAKLSAVLVLATGLLLAPMVAVGADPVGVANATIAFDTGSGMVESMVASPTPAPGYQPGGLFYSFCWPPKAGEVPQAGETIDGSFTVGVDGALAGSCTMHRPMADGGTIDRTSTLTGQYDRAAGLVAFHLAGSQARVTIGHPRAGETERYEDTTSLVVDAERVVVAGARATGRARFTWSLASISGNATASITKVTGTIGFTMVLGPEESAASVPAGGGTTPAGAGGTEGTEPRIGTFSALWYAGMVALGLGAVAAALLVIRRRRARELAALGIGGPTLAAPPAPGSIDGAEGTQAAVTADRLGGFEDSLSYAEGAGKAIPGVSRALEGLVVAQAKGPTRRDELPQTPAGATADELRTLGAVRNVARDRGGAGQPEHPPRFNERGSVVGPQSRGLANPPSDQYAALTADRFGGFEDSEVGVGEGAGKAAPGLPRAYDALVVGQAPPSSTPPRISPTGATAEALEAARRERLRDHGETGEEPPDTRRTPPGVR